MIENLISDNYLSDYGIFISCGLILSCSVYYLIRSNYIANLPNNTEVLTNQEIGNITNDNMLPNIEDFLTDSEIETEFETESESESAYDWASSTNFDEILKDQDIFILPPFESKFKDVEFIMPDVDFNVCPIQELKLFEFCSLFGKEMVEHSITEEEMMELICLFPEKVLATNWINDLLLAIIELL